MMKTLTNFFAGNCPYYHKEYKTDNRADYYPEIRSMDSRGPYRERHPVTRTHSPTRGPRRADAATPTPATRLRNIHLQTSRNTQPRMATSNANAERQRRLSISVAAQTGEAASSTTLANEASSSTISANEVPSSTTERDHDDIVIYEPRLKVEKRFLKTECVLITQIIEENSQNTDLDAIAILDKASEAVMRLGITHSARDCWIYWSHMGRKQSIVARDWPPEAEDVDEEVMAFERIRRAPDAVMLLAVPATKASELLSREQKEHLFEVIKKMESSQYGMPVETFWCKVEEAMNKAGYADDRHKQREYWEEDGRQEFAYDERQSFNRRIKNTATKQTNPTSPKSPASRIRLSSRRNNARLGVMSTDYPIQQNNSKKRRSDQKEQVQGERLYSEERG